MLYYSYINIVGSLTYKKYTSILCNILNKVKLPEKKPYVLLIQTICNDFDQKNLSQIMKQTYKNYDVVLLDDSNNDEQIKMIDEFAVKNNLKVVRRPQEHKNKWRTKAGNVDYYIKNIMDSKYKYIVITESTSLISNDYIEKNIKYFYSDYVDNLALVTDISASYLNRSFISSMLIIEEQLINSNFFVELKYNWAYPQGFAYMIKADVIKNINLEEINNVTDDFSTGIFLLKNNYKIIYSTLSCSGKKKPIDFQAFSIQKAKWISARYKLNHTVFKLNGVHNKFFTFLSFLFYYFQTISGSFCFLVTMVINISLFLMGLDFLVLLIPNIIIFTPTIITGIFIFAIFLRDIKNFAKYILFIILCGLMWYSNIIYIFIQCIKAIFTKGNVKFIVTRKKTVKYTFWQLIKMSLLSIFCLIIFVGCYIFSIYFWWNKYFNINNFDNNIYLCIMNYILYSAFCAAIIFIPICNILFTFLNNKELKINEEAQIDLRKYSSLFHTSNDIQMKNCFDYNDVY